MRSSSFDLSSVAFFIRSSNCSNAWSNGTGCHVGAGYALKSRRDPFLVADNVYDLQDKHGSTAHPRRFDEHNSANLIYLPFAAIFANERIFRY